MPARGLGRNRRTRTPARMSMGPRPIHQPGRTVLPVRLRPVRDARGDIPGRFRWSRRPQHVRHGLSHRKAPEAHAGARPQQDPGRAALQRVPRVLPGECGRVLRLVLRLLPARGVPAPQRHVHRKGLQPERRDRQAAARGNEGALRTTRRDHRRVRQLHLRPRGAGGLRRHRHPTARRWPVPARRRAPPAGRPAVPAERPGPHPCTLPGSRGHPRAAARPRRLRRARPVLRRRGRADRGDRPADRRGACRTQGGRGLPGLALRHPRGQAQGRHRRHRGRDGGALHADGGGRPGARGRPPATADHLRPGDDARAGLLLRASRTTRAICRGGPPAPGRGRCSTTSRPTGCWWSTRAT